jgi:molybdenum cofactor guanylyltransferase
MEDVTGVILAGGKNSRFDGRDKAFVPVDGVPMIERIINVTAGLFDNTIVVTGHPERYPVREDLHYVSDVIKGVGPLGGIHSAMTKSEAPWIFVFSCDMPYLDRNIIKGQYEYLQNLEFADALIPRINSMPEPLHALYRTGLREDLENFLYTAADYSIRAFLNDKKVHYYDLESSRSVRKAFCNINKPADIPGQKNMPFPDRRP